MNRKITSFTDHAVGMDPSGLPTYVINAAAAMTYVTEPSVWPQFIEWIRRNHPEAIPPDFDSEMFRDAHMHDVARVINHFVA